jgi:hypothetical protein
MQFVENTNIRLIDPKVGHVQVCAHLRGYEVTRLSTFRKEEPTWEFNIHVQANKYFDQWLYDQFYNENHLTLNIIKGDLIQLWNNVRIASIIQNSSHYDKTPFWKIRVLG